MSIAATLLNIRSRVFFVVNPELLAVRPISQRLGFQQWHRPPSGEVSLGKSLPQLFSWPGRPLEAPETHQMKISETWRNMETHSFFESVYLQPEHVVQLPLYTMFFFINVCKTWHVKLEKLKPWSLLYAAEVLYGVSRFCRLDGRSTMDVAATTKPFASWKAVFFCCQKSKTRKSPICNINSHPKNENQHEIISGIINKTNIPQNHEFNWQFPVPTPHCHMASPWPLRGPRLANLQSTFTETSQWWTQWEKDAESCERVIRSYQQKVETKSKGQKKNQKNDGLKS